MTESKAVSHIRAATKLRPPPLVLPNVATLTRQLQLADRTRLAPQLAKSKRVIAFFSNPKYHWMIAPRKAKCWDVAWQRQCTVARAQLRLHHALAEEAQQRLWRELPDTGDWLTAVRIAQRVYPGTADWMLYISHREGGYGPWVWWSGACSNSPCLWRGYHVGYDSTGDTVGGWMQFRWSTFAPYYRGMVKDLAARGYTLPVFKMPPAGGPIEYAPWLDPLGQALTAGYMRYYGKDGCHWCL